MIRIRLNVALQVVEVLNISGGFLLRCFITRSRDLKLAAHVFLHPRLVTIRVVLEFERGAEILHELRPDLLGILLRISLAALRSLSELWMLLPECSQEHERWEPVLGFAHLLEQVAERRRQIRSTAELSDAVLRELVGREERRGRCRGRLGPVHLEFLEQFGHRTQRLQCSVGVTGVAHVLQARWYSTLLLSQFGLRHVFSKLHPLFWRFRDDLFRRVSDERDGLARLET
jgi:hypothetical protein